MSSINVGSVRVDVVPDASRFNERLKADLSRLPSAVIKVDADVTAAAAHIDELTRGRTSTVNVDADTAGAAAHIDELTRRRDAKVNVDVDTGAAEAKIAAVGASASSAGGGMSALLTAGLALGPAIIPVAAAAAAAILGIGSAALAAGPALGALFLGFSGVSDAVGALGKADASSAASGAASAAARVAQTNAIVNAQASLAGAERTAASAAISSAQAVIDAERGVVDAKRSASQAVASAIQQQLSAEQSLATAQDTARASQLALTQARVAARQSIEDLTNSVADGALAQRQANLNVESTKLALDNLGPSSTDLQRKQAQLAYDQALQQVTDLSTRQQRLVDQKKAADKAGVSGAANVVAAQQNVTKSVAGVASAQTALGRAEAAVTEARRAGAERVAVAQESVTKALAAQANTAASSAASIASAQRQVQQAMAQTSTAGTAAGTALQQAMDKLSPAGRDFAKFIYSLKPEFDRLKATAQGALLPGVTTFFKELTPLMPVFNQIIGAAAGALGDLFAAAGKALQAPFWKTFFDFLASTVGPNITIFGQILGDLATGFAGLLMAFAPVGDKVMGVIAGLATSFADWAKNLSGSSGFKAFMAYLAENGPKVWGLLGDLLQLSVNLLIAFAPLGSVILDVLGKLASMLAKMSPEQITLVALAIGAIATALSGQWIALAVIAIGGVVTGFIDWYNHSKTLRDWVHNKLLPALKTLWQWIQDTLIPVLTGILKQAWEGIQTAVKNVTGAFKDNKVQLGQLWEAFKGFVNFVVTKVWPILGPVAKAVFIALGAIISWEINNIGLLVDAFNFFKTTVGTVLKAVVGSFLTMAGGVLHAADTAFGWMKLPFSNQLHAAAVKFDAWAAGIIKSTNSLNLNPKITVTAKLATSVLGQLPNGQNYWAPGVSIGPKPKLFTGGPILGAGTGTSDDVPFMGSNGEHVITASEVAAAGGHAAIFAYRKQLRGFAAGGPVISTSLANPAVLKQSYDARIVATIVANLGTLLKSAAAATSTGGSTGSLAGFTSGGGTSGANQVLGKAMMLAMAWAANQWPSLKALWTQESGWNQNAHNPSSGAHGIPQSLPASKMASAGADYMTNPATQMRWGLGYIKGRYGSPSAAMAHERAFNWYANGTNHAAPGYAWVGERGKELMRFGGGEQITPNHMLGGGFDYDKLAQAMTRVQIGLDGRGVAASVDHRLGAAIR